MASVTVTLFLTILCLNWSPSTTSPTNNVTKVIGCCFNGTNHEVGSIVKEVPEACLRFVCAVSQSSSTSSAVIVPLHIPLNHCTGTPCEGCFSTHCIDEKGLLHALGSHWMPTKCIRCNCGAGQITNCEPVPVLCPIQPDPSCVAVPDPCCPTWNCSSSNKCVDSEGKIRGLDEEWGTPCLRNRCTSSGVVTLIIDCPPVPSINASCRLITPEGECCPRIECGGCTDSEGKPRKLNEEWGSPCIKNICTSQGIVTRIEDCIPPLFPNASCQLYTPENECCPQLSCGCIDNEGKFRKLNEEWGTPCILNICTSNGIATRIEDCIPTPLLNDSCRVYTPENQCCPVITCGPDCSAVRCGLPPRPGNHCELYTPPLSCCPLWNCSGGCIDEIGKYREIGAIWNPTPCNESVCTKNGIVSKTLICKLSDPPHLNCELVTPPGKCCPDWNCGPDCRVVRCGLPPKPANQCELYTPHLSCCPLWNCSGGCVDENGKYHELGAIWNPTPCDESVCTKDGAVSKTVNCTISDPPHFNCELVKPLDKCCPEWKCGPDCRLVKCGIPPKPGNFCELYTPHLSCCPVWNCSCVDTDSRSHPLGSNWEKNCIVYKCKESGIEESYVQCNLSEPEHFNCIPITDAGECCPKWKCGPNCALVLCEGPPHENCTAEPLQPLSCCATYTCPQHLGDSCLDANGIHHPVGSYWEKDCVSYKCTESGIVRSAVPCNLKLPEHYNCIPVIRPGECCPKWECGPNCAAVLCAGPPRQNCRANPLPPLACCATYTCPKSSDSSSDGIFPEEADVLLSILL